MTEPRGSRRDRLTPVATRSAGHAQGRWQITVSVPVLMPTSHEPSVNRTHAHQKGTTTMFDPTPKLTPTALGLWADRRHGMDARRHEHDRDIQEAVR